MPGLTIVPPLAPPVDFDAETDAFWAAVARAAGEALMAMSPQHRDIARLREFVAVTRRAGGLPAARAVESATAGRVMAPAPPPIGVETTR